MILFLCMQHHWHTQYAVLCISMQSCSNLQCFRAQHRPRPLSLRARHAHALPFGIKLPWPAVPLRQNRAKDLEGELEDLVQGTNFGARIPADTAQATLRIIEDLQPFSPLASSPVAKLYGEWELQYTTEKSVHSIVKTFNVQTITQTIDGAQQRVTNRIQFSDTTSLQASAPMKAVSNNRIEYQFDSLTLTLFGLQLSLDAIVRGGGWTEAMYCTQDKRIMQNSQGDTLVFYRVGSE